MAYREVVLREFRVQVAEIRRADEYALPVPGEGALQVHYIDGSLAGRDTGLAGAAQLAGVLVRTRRTDLRNQLASL